MPEPIPSNNIESEAKGGEQWTKETVWNEFEHLGARPPALIVRRKSDGVQGTIMRKFHPDGQAVYYKFSPSNIPPTKESIGEFETHKFRSSQEIRDDKDNPGI